MISKKKIIAGLIMINLALTAHADYAADMQYLAGKSFILKWYDSYDLKSTAGNRNANDACVDFYKTIVSNQQYPNQDWLEGCAYALQGKRGW